jgi:hypothetical protein
MPWNFEEKIIFLPTSDAELFPNRKSDFTPQEKADILAAIQTAYYRSSTVEAMFKSWLGDPYGEQDNGRTVTFIFEKDSPGTAKLNGGKIYLDPGTLILQPIINRKGEAVMQTLAHLLFHELGHALLGLKDSAEDQSPYTDITGGNGHHANQIYLELGLDERISYLGVDPGSQSGQYLLRVGYQYTDRIEIDNAFVRDWAFFDSSSLTTLKGNLSRDLLIGGLSANEFISGAGDDFLYGAGGNDTLNGGDGKDTAGFYGTKDSYKFGKDKDGKWTVSHDLGAKENGIDTLENIEFAMFDDVITAPNGTTLPTKRKVALLEGQDICFVIDTTTSA